MRRLTTERCWKASESGAEEERPKCCGWKDVRWWDDEGDDGDPFRGSTDIVMTPNGLITG